jgi:hypothetical protein
MEIELNPRWRPNKNKNEHLSPRSETNIFFFYLSFATFGPPLLFHYPLPLTEVFNTVISWLSDLKNRLFFRELM